MSLIIGIDPGQNNGIAIFKNKALTELTTVNPVELVKLLDAIFYDYAVSEARKPQVFFEDSRLTSPVWSRGTTLPVRLKIARNVGHVDAICGIIEDICKQFEVKCIGISPKNKGAKLNAEQFKALTEWDKRSNQHERDAACVVWPYRSAK